MHGFEEMLIKKTITQRCRGRQVCECWCTTLLCLCIHTRVLFVHCRQRIVRPIIASAHDVHMYLSCCFRSVQSRDSQLSSAQQIHNKFSPCMEQRQPFYADIPGHGLCVHSNLVFLFFWIIAVTITPRKLLKHSFRTATCDFMDSNQAIGKVFLFNINDFCSTYRGANDRNKTYGIKTSWATAGTYAFSHYQGHSLSGWNNSSSTHMATAHASLRSTSSWSAWFSLLVLRVEDKFLVLCQNVTHP